LFESGFRALKKSIEMKKPTAIIIDIVGV